MLKIHILQICNKKGTVVCFVWFNEQNVPVLQVALQWFEVNKSMRNCHGNLTGEEVLPH